MITADYDRNMKETSSFYDSVVESLNSYCRRIKKPSVQGASVKDSTTSTARRYNAVTEILWYDYS